MVAEGRDCERRPGHVSWWDEDLAPAIGFLNAAPLDRHLKEGRMGSLSLRLSKMPWRARSVSLPRFLRR